MVTAIDAHVAGPGDCAGASGEPGTGTSASTPTPRSRHKSGEHAAFDVVVANYVVMSLPDLAATVAAFTPR